MSKRGFTIVEIVIAISVLSVGLLALVTTAAAVTRMISQGQRYSQASALATQKFEIMRSRMCAIGSGADTVGKVIRTWTFTSINSGAGRRWVMTVKTPTGRGTHTDKFSQTVACS